MTLFARRSRPQNHTSPPSTTHAAVQCGSPHTTRQWPDGCVSWTRPPPSSFLAAPPFRGVSPGSRLPRPTVALEGRARMRPPSGQARSSMLCGAGSCSLDLARCCAMCAGHGALLALKPRRPIAPTNRLAGIDKMMADSESPPLPSAGILCGVVAYRTNSREVGLPPIG